MMKISKEWKKKQSDSTSALKDLKRKPKVSNNPRRGHNTFHQMTRNQYGNNGLSFRVVGGEAHESDFKRPGVVNFSQRNLGNSLMQSIVQGPKLSEMRKDRGSLSPTAGALSHTGSSSCCPSKSVAQAKIQPKLAIGQANDVYEYEADQVAAQVMEMSDSGAKRDSDFHDTGVNIRRESVCGDGNQNIGPIPQIKQTGGRPLSASTRRFMEPRFGVSFGHVRLHGDRDAHRTASRIHAKAFTYGNHIFLGRGYDETDKLLMSHELTHVLQQHGMVDNYDDSRKTKNQAPSPLIDKISQTQAPILSRLPNCAGNNCVFLDLQLVCMNRLGGCTRPGGIPTEEEISRYDTECRSETGYSGPAVTLDDLECENRWLAIAESLALAYPAWHGSPPLPNCPCTAQEAESSSDWQSSNWFLFTYHSGACSAYRTNRGYESVPNTSHGQQCTYDAEGNLITGGAGAGTPDVWSPATHFWRHQNIDVDTWRNLGWETYNRYWPPNHGDECDRNEPSGSCSWPWYRTIPQRGIIG